MLTPADLAAIAARLEAARGEGGVHLAISYEHGALWYGDGDGLGTIRGNLGSGHDGEAVGTLLAHAPADLAALLAEVERLRADGDEMQRAAERAAEAENANAAELATVKAERDALPRHLRLALSNAQQAFEAGEYRSLATINEDIQPLVDAAMAQIARLEAERDEAVAALANERGEGDGPSPEWECTVTATGPRWRNGAHTINVRRCTGAQPGASPTGWYWRTGEGLAADIGFAPTAREAMRLADAELARRRSTGRPE